MGLQAVWVPGYVAQAQVVGPGHLNNVNNVPWSDVVGYREGFGVTFRLPQGKGNWFHFAIPTPVIMENKRAKLRGFFVLYETDLWAMLDEVHVYDGPNQINRHPNLTGTGNHATVLDSQNSFAETLLPEIKFGVGVSVRIMCSPGIDASIKFAGAGADFIF